MHPFGTPILVVADCFRVLCVFIAALVIFFQVKMITEDRIFKKKVPFKSSILVMTALAILCFSIMFTEIGRLGSEITWRLPTNIAGVSLALYASKRRTDEINLLNDEKDAREAKIRKEEILKELRED